MKKRTHSKEHIRKLRIARAKRVKEKHPRWKGGRNISFHGYVIIWTDKGMKKEHRHIMELHIGRKLKSREHVHHKNGVKTDNRIENLEIIDKIEHAKMHYRKELSFKKGHKPWNKGLKKTK